MGQLVFFPSWTNKVEHKKTLKKSILLCSFVVNFELTTVTFVDSPFVHILCLLSPQAMSLSPVISQWFLLFLPYQSLSSFRTILDLFADLTFYQNVTSTRKVYCLYLLSLLFSVLNGYLWFFLPPPVARLRQGDFVRLVFHLDDYYLVHLTLALMILCTLFTYSASPWSHLSFGYLRISSFGTPTKPWLGWLTVLTLKMRPCKWSSWCLLIYFRSLYCSLVSSWALLVSKRLMR